MRGPVFLAIGVACTFTVAPASAATLGTDWSIVGNAGTAEPNGVVSEAPEPVKDYYYVSTFGGVDGAGALENVGGVGTPTNGSTLKSPTFAANAGDSIVFYFDFVTSDGAGYADYTWARLINVEDGSNTAVLFTARTTPGGDTVPGFSMPEPSASLKPSSSPIDAGAPTWDQLGDSSGACYSVGCGSTGWIRSTSQITETGTYRLEFGATNWNDTAYDTGMAIAEATPDFSPVPGPKESGDFLTRDLVGDVDTFDPSKPTVVLTHGWQRTGTYDATLENVGFSKQMYDEIRDRTNGEVNIVAYVWEEAYFSEFTRISDVSKEITQNIGLDLALRIRQLGGTEYEQPIHFIGHSLGSDVNATAARYVDSFGLNVAHVTTLDAPIGYGVSSAPYLYLAQKSNIPLLDNYWGSEKTGGLVVIGSPIKGWKFGGGTEYQADHSGVWEEYLETIKAPPSDGKGGFYYSATLGDSGGFAGATGFTGPVQPVLFDVSMANLDPISLINASFNTANSTLDLSTGSNGYASFSVDIPDGASSLMFDLLVKEAGASDWLEVVLGGQLLATLQMALFEDVSAQIFLDLIGVPAGKNDLYFLLADASGTGSSITASNFGYVVPSSQQIATVPLPAGGWMLLTAFSGLLLLRLRRRS